MPRLRDKDKTQEQLVKEITELRQRIAELERAENERKQAEEALRESEEQLEAIFNEVSDGIVLLDLTGKIIKINKRVTDVTGYTEKYIVGKRFNFFKNFTSQSITKMISAFTKTVAGQQMSPFEVEGYTKAGERRIGEIYGSLLRKKSKAVGVLVVMEDITERKQAEEALRESEQKYRTILQSMKEGYYEVDLAGNFTFFNEALLRIHGRSRDEMMGLNNREYSCPETAKRIYAIFNKVYKTGIPARIVDYEVIRKDGSVAMVEESVSLLRNAAGKPIGFYGISRDRTEQKRAEKALGESEEKYRTILETMEEGYYEVDLAGNLTFFNDSMCRIYGYTRDEMMGTNNRAYMSPETAKRTYRLFNQVYKTGETTKIFDWKFIRKNGSTITVEISVSLMRDSTGEPVGFRGILRDITERKQAEEALRESEEKYRTILETIEDGYYEVDLAGNFTFFNDSMCRIWGYSKEELMGMNNREYTSPETSKKIYETFNAVYKTGEPTKIFDWELIKKDGSTIYVEISISLMRDPKGEPVGFRGILRDITERKRAEEALRESEEKYRSLVEFTEDPVYLINRQKEFLFLNETYLSRLGLPRDQVIGRRYGEFHSRKEGKEFAEHIEQVFTTGRFVQYEHRSRRDDRYFLRTLSPVKKPDGSIETVTVIAKDITERKRAEEELEYMATHDSLTGLPNRTLFTDRLTMVLAQARRSQKHLAVMLLDLDYFKNVNDTLGHTVGDQLLRLVGNRLSEVLRKGDTVARIGGDEFLLLLPEIARIEDAIIIAEKILDAFHTAFFFGDHKLLISASIGIAIYPEDGDDADTLMKNADIAMYRVKDKGRGTYQRYAP